MALSDLAVFSEYAYAAMTEVLDQQIDLFNSASAGSIILAGSAHQGDYSDVAFWQRVSGGTVRRRNAYGSGAIDQKSMKQIIDTMVKIAAGTYEMDFPPSEMKWIQVNPQERGAAFGQQLAKDVMADMLNTSIGAGRLALSQDASTNVYDATGLTDKEGPTMTPTVLARTAGKFGDRSSAIAAWIMHSGVITDLWVNALQNAERLFVYSNVNIIRDAFGRLFVVSDCDNLTWTDTGGEGGAARNGFYTLGLQPGAIVIGQNNDFVAGEQTITGLENLTTRYQAEWSWQLGVMGYSWDKSTGGKSPNDAAILSAANWERYSNSHKDLAGVYAKTL